MTAKAMPSFRRAFVWRALSMLGLVGSGFSLRLAATTISPDRRWYEAAVAQLRLAQSWGDQPYGAVVVAGDLIVGSCASQVRKRNDINAHAERLAILDAQTRLGRQSLSGSVLYSTSRPCRLCEMAAAKAQVSRMIHGEALHDAGAPQP